MNRQYKELVEAVADMTWWVGKASSQLNVDVMESDVLEGWFRACKRVDSKMTALNEAIRASMKTG